MAPGQRRPFHLVRDGQALWRRRACCVASYPHYRRHRFRGIRRDHFSGSASAIRRTQFRDRSRYRRHRRRDLYQAADRLCHPTVRRSEEGNRAHLRRRPDPEWTPQILDILKANHVPATFFIIGSNAEANPDLVKRIVDDGFEVGSHTFTHPNLSDTPEEAIPLEMNATQRLFQALTGRSLRLFRPPYLGDAEPTDEDQIAPVET